MFAVSSREGASVLIGLWGGGKMAIVYTIGVSAVSASAACLSALCSSFDMDWSLAFARASALEFSMENMSLLEV